MPVPIPGLKVESDKQKVEFLTIPGRPKTGIFRGFRGVPGRAPLATNHAENVDCIGAGSSLELVPPRRSILAATLIAPQVLESEK